MAPRLGDPLKLAAPGRINLGPGEVVLGSGKAAGGAVRWVLTDALGQVTARIGIGAPWFGGREDESGPWTADMDRSAALNEGRAALRAEYDAIEQRLGEIDAADQYAAAGPGKTPADLAAEREAIRARQDEIREYDHRVTRARQWHEFGNDYDGTGQAPDGADQWLTGYCAPGEFDRLKARMNDLRKLPEPPADDDGWPRPAEPGERERLSARYQEFEDIDTGEVYAAGYTARLDLDALDRLRADTAPAVARAREYGAEMVAYYAERDRLEAAVNSVLGVDRDLTDAEHAQLGADRAALDAHKASPEPPAPDDLVDGYFGQGVIPGTWGDVHWRVEFDETANLDLGVVPHGQTEVKTLYDLADQELSARLSLGLDLCGYNDPDHAGQLFKQLNRMAAAGHAAQAAAPPGAGPAAAPGPPAALSRFGNVTEAWSELMAVPLPANGAIEPLDEWFAGFGDMFAQMGQTLGETVEEWRSDRPVAVVLLDHLASIAVALLAMGCATTDLLELWRTEHAEAIRRQRNPAPGQAMLNVTP